MEGGVIACFVRKLTSAVCANGQTMAGMSGPGLGLRAANSC